ncbi:MAG: YceI family protein [Deltaproteobacteria bacterium]|nr:YceI family protein [Deltaproteobacteria bacterium]
MVVFLVAPSLSRAASWDIDPVHTSVTFKVRHMMVSDVRGEFAKVSGKVDIDPKDAAKSSVDVTIDVASINTRDAKRDGHLKSADFFDVAKFPNSTFKSTKVEAAGKGKLKVHGNLTMRGVSKLVVLEVEGPSPEVKGPWGSFHSGATATAKINRKDFGVSWNQALDAGGVVVGEEVTIFIDVELTRKASS